MADTGTLKVQLYNEGSYVPIEGAKVTVTSKSEPGAQRIETKETSNANGETSIIELPTPPLANSIKPGSMDPYSLYNIKVEAEGFEPLIIDGAQLFPDTLAIQPCNMVPKKSLRKDTRENEIIVVNSNTLLGEYPRKIPEDPDKALPPPPSGSVVLPKPVIPEFVVVHAGMPNNNNAPNYTVRFKDYIKNVASCEIYATWSENAIRANIYCILSFTLNRIYTEWYRGKGKNFDITNSTAYDHAFTYGRNIFDSISVVVDDIFSSYIKRWNKKQPLLAQYCDGRQVQCPGWLTQWGSQELGQKGLPPYEILTSFYGNDIELVRAEEVKGIPKSYPGYSLELGYSGEPVRVVQQYLNRIGDNYPAIKKVKVDGVYGPATQESVKKFQEVFNLPQTGIVDYATWYAISDIYVGVTKIAELRSSVGMATFTPHVPYTGINDIPTVEYPIDLF